MLTGIRVYKFKLNKQLTLLGDEYDGGTATLYPLKLGSHENFYRDKQPLRVSQYQGWASDVGPWLGFACTSHLESALHVSLF